MAGFYMMDMSPRQEELGDEERLERAPLGTFLLSFLDQEWQGLADEAMELRRRAYLMEQAQRGFDSLRRRFQGAHPLFRQELDRLSASADSLYALGQWAGEMARFHPLLYAAVERVLDRDTGDGGADGRYRALLSEIGELSRLAERFHEGVSVRYHMGAGGGKLCYGAKDLRILLYLSFEYMVSQGTAFRRCLNCGRYFIPFSVHTCYCDRPAGEGKTCKSYAAKANYSKRLQADEGRSFYVKQNNAYQMRVRRSPELYPQEEYRLWQTRVRSLLEQLDRGEVSWEAFQEQAKLPGRRRPGAVKGRKEPPQAE